MTKEEKPKPNNSEDQKRLGGLESLGTPHYKPVVYPAAIKFVFPCKRCDKGFAIEDGVEEGVNVRTAMSKEHAEQMLTAFAKTVEPRIIKCPCGYEAEYFREDVRVSVLEAD